LSTRQFLEHETKKLKGEKGNKDRNKSTRFPSTATPRCDVSLGRHSALALVPQAADESITGGRPKQQRAASTIQIQISTLAPQPSDFGALALSRPVISHLHINSNEIFTKAETKHAEGSAQNAKVWNLLQAKH